jgi:uncharacterized membrane protein YeaQ/YmgE (transglycosylase-associated protein family)
MPEFAMMGLVSWIFMGLLAGALGRFVLPGKDDMGCIGTIVAGVVGAVVGGFVATALGFGGFQGFDIYSLLLATVGAILFLLILRLLSGGKKKAERR